MYAADWKMCVPTKATHAMELPRISCMVLIGVTVLNAAEFLELKIPTELVLFELVRGWVTHSEPDLGEMHELVEPRRPQG